MKCKRCGDIPNNYSMYLICNYCFPCLHKIAQDKLVEWKKDSPIFDITEELKEALCIKDTGGSE